MKEKRENDILNTINCPACLLIPIANKLILNDDVNAFKELINSDRRIKLQDPDTGYTFLHEAIRSSSFNIFTWLLEQKKIDIDSRNREHRTPLLVAVQHLQVEMAQELLQRGCSVDLQGKAYQIPLHEAVARSCEIAHLMIKRGADIDFQDISGNTPLHKAIMANNLESVCMLLYYNADTELRNNEGKTPFMTSLRFGISPKIQTTLLEYVVDFNYICTDRKSALIYAMEITSQIAHEILKRGEYLDLSWSNKRTALELSLTYKNKFIFDIIFSMFDREMFNYPFETSFLQVFLTRCTFSKLQWLKCIYDILSSNYAVEFINEIDNSSENNSTKGVCGWLINSFDLKSIDQQDRIKIIYLVLSLGATVFCFDISLIYRRYGFEEEFRIFLDFPVIERVHGDAMRNPIDFFIFNFNVYNDDTIVKTFSHDCFIWHYLPQFVEYILNVSPFFTLSLYLVPFRELLSDEIVSMINQMPLIPSLKELSRNKTIGAIALKFPEKSSVFHHAYLKKLPIPYMIRDILQLKIPIYECF